MEQCHMEVQGPQAKNLLSQSDVHGINITSFLEGIWRKVFFFQYACMQEAFRQQMPPEGLSCNKWYPNWSLMRRSLWSVTKCQQDEPKLFVPNFFALKMKNLCQADILYPCVSCPMVAMTRCRSSLAYDNIW